MRQQEFDNFTLVGGTSLALQIGHRISIDIDLFGKSEIDEQAFLQILKNKGDLHVLKKSKNILICSVGGIKVDFVNYQYDMLEKPIIIDSIRLTSMQDIAAMKINAIAGRGSKKDFIDFYYLLGYYTLEEMLSFYLKKYPDGSEFMARKSLTYFDDADNEETPLIFENISWQVIKKKILDEQ
jgi:hypothetical protein